MLIFIFCTIFITIKPYNDPTPILMDLFANLEASYGDESLTRWTKSLYSDLLYHYQLFVIVSENRKIERVCIFNVVSMVLTSYCQYMGIHMLYSVHKSLVFVTFWLQLGC